MSERPRKGSERGWRKEEEGNGERKGRMRRDKKKGREKENRDIKGEERRMGKNGGKRERKGKHKVHETRKD